MKIKFYNFLLIFSVAITAFCYSVPNEKLFLKALKAGGIPWMDEQIKSDLEPFQEGISTELVDQTLKKLDVECLLLVRIVVKNGVITCSPHKQSDVRLEAYLRALEYLNRVVGLPDVDFILTLGDSTSGILPENQNFIFGYGTYAPGDKQLSHGGIMIPDFIALLGLEYENSCVDGGVLKYSWKKKIKKGFWRGSTTGYIATAAGYICGYCDSNWDQFPRTRLALYSKERPDVVDAKITNVCQVIPGNEVHDILAKLDLLGASASIEDHLKYAYLVDVDGNGMSVPRCYWVLRSNSLLVKQQSDWVLWYSRGLVPYVNYVPFTNPGEDLETVIEWAKAHDDQAKRIAYEGRRFAMKDLSIENTYLYLYKVLMAYSALQCR